MSDIFQQLFSIWISEVGEEITRRRVKAYINKLTANNDTRILLAVLEAAQRLDLIDQ